MARRRTRVVAVILAVIFGGLAAAVVAAVEHSGPSCTPGRSGHTITTCPAGAGIDWLAVSVAGVAIAIIVALLTAAWGWALARPPEIRLADEPRPATENLPAPADRTATEGRAGVPDRAATEQGPTPAS